MHTKTPRSRRRTCPGSGMLAVFAAAVGSLAAAAPADVIREGTGARREALNEMELKPFDQNLWSELSSWTNGDPITPSAIDGKVVVIYTFSSFLPQSLRPLVALDRLQKRYEDQGVVVVGVHHPQRFDDAERQVSRRRASIVFAHDADGRFRDALRVDQDPDLYVIDRAGHLRYADIETGSIDDALTELIAESPVAAGSVLDRRAQAKRDAEREARRSASLRSQVDLATLPEVPFTMPGPEAFDDVDWPTFYEYQEPGRGRGRDREEDSPRPISLPAEGNYKPAPPTEKPGRVTMLYFWTPDRGMAAWNEFYDEMQQIQREHPRDLQIVGVAVPVEQQNRGRRGNDEDEQRRVERLQKRFNEFFGRKPLNHTILDQIDGSGLLNEVAGGGSSRGGRGNYVIPYAALISSDGQLRWHGIYTWQQEEFRDAFQRILRDDPGVRARRDAEKAFINAQVERQLGDQSSAPAPTANADIARVSMPTSAPAAAYASAAWPRSNDPRMLSGRDVQGRPLPVPMGRETWLTERVDDLDHRVKVLDFWATWCGPCIRAAPTLAGLQSEFEDDLAVIAVSGQGESKGTVESYIEGKGGPEKAKYSHVFDGSQRVYKSLQIRGIPHVVVMSTDGVVRWQGNPLDPAFAEAVRRVMSVDPLVAARREARQG